MPVYFMHGNRDFLVAERFAAITGVKLLGDPSVVELYGELRDQLSARPESFQALQQLLRRHCSQCAEFSSGPALFITRAGSGFWGLNPAEVASRRHGVA